MGTPVSSRLARLGRWSLILLGSSTLTAGSFVAWASYAQQRRQAENAVLEELYVRADSVYRRRDSVFVVSRKLDTVAVATGIFTYLKYYYPVEMSAPIHRYCKQAVELTQRGQPVAARQQLQELIEYYRSECQPYSGFSDLNNLLTVGTQDAILCAYAYQQLGRLDAALAVLRPWLAHSETIGTKVHQFYLELCLQRYGRPRVQREMANAPRTLHRTRRHDTDTAPEYDAWVIDVFGAEIGVADGPSSVDDPPTVASVAAELPKQDFYRVLR